MKGTTVPSKSPIQLTRAHQVFCLILACCLSVEGSTSLAFAVVDPSPRAAVQNFFKRLKAGQYDAVYDDLPSQVQQQVTREQLIQSLKRLESFLVMDKMEIGRVQQRAEAAVVDTTIYGRLKRPMKIEGEDIFEGRVDVQQYLIKEGRDWRVITADDRTRAYFLRRNPEFNRGFELSAPRFAYKKRGEWQPL